MGVPKFFRYTSERYPCLNELVKQYQIPDFDNMYLDMNGIIHNCSHPDDSNPHFRITEEKIFEDVFHYISILFQIIKPKKLFFMAIDGVAPRAKMNQQRGRRFRSAKEAEKLEEEAVAKGEVLPKEKRFDSNCITPGTVFMARLHEQLRYFVKMKISTDPLWSKVKVILSGHETPGEGEHKIMDYIRWARSQDDYDPNTRHCLYGLDADLIMLGMCTHEPHFALLREEVKFGKTTQRATSPEETNFFLLHLSLLREYLEQEFIDIKDKLPFQYDLEKIVDDWVLMGFLVGNDFIPNLPNMHISNDALPVLYKTYMTVLPTLDGYINEAGNLNLGRFETFMQELAKIDKEKFEDEYADLKYFEAKTGRRPNMLERKEYKPNNDETFNVNVDEIKTQPDDELLALINATHEMFLDGEDALLEYEENSDEEESTIDSEFLLHKRDYYMNKLDYSKVTDEVLADQAEGYVRAIQWNLFYYYKGCPSWCWYYPHHYAPYISDIKGFKDLKLEFELGDPFKPFEQLLAVLPAASKHLLPTPFHDLMTAEDSPIVHYYPINFETDLNGKKNDWEAVVLIPFIDETNLLSAMSPCYQRLTDEEQKRNSHGPMLIYTWNLNSQGAALAPDYFPAIEDCHAVEQSVWRNEIDVPEAQLKRGMLPNANRALLYPGFPTMRHLQYKTQLKVSKVQVFDQPSRNLNMMITIIPENYVSEAIEKTAQELLGKIIWVGWPHLTRAKVISVSNESKRLHHIDQQNNNVNGIPSYSTEANTGNLHKQWISERSTILEHNKNRLGIELDAVKTIIHAVNLKGYKYMIQDNVRMVQEPEWCSVPCGYAYQAVVKDVKAHIVQEVTRFSTPQEAYPPGDSVFLLTQGQYYGCLATVLDSEAIRSGRIKVCVAEREEPAPIVKATASPYKNTSHAAAAAGMSPQMISRITGTILVVYGEPNDMPTETQMKTNIGLNLKFNKKNQEISGYTRRCKLTRAWMYSQRCIELVKDYANNFPTLIDKLTHIINDDVFFEGDLWPGEVGKKKPQEVTQWIKSQPHMKAAKRECGSEALEPEELRALADEMLPQLDKLQEQEKKVTLHVKWSLLYKPELHAGSIQPDPNTNYKMYDRVVCVAKNITVPIGAKGTVTAIYPPPNSNTVRLSDKLNAEATYQVMFDEPFPGAQSEELFDQNRFYRMLPTNMLNISFGRKIRNQVQYISMQDPYSLPSKPPSAHSAPTLLRREDGHNSAFASYSPPARENKTPVNDTRNNATPTTTKATSNNSNPTTNIAANDTETQDNATHLLRSLLKISVSDDTKKNNKNTQEQNWRSKNENIAQAAPPPQRTQQQNWRKENSTAANKPGIYANPAEWTNSNFKKQTPLPPYPTFGQPFAGPGPHQVPFPQFQNAHFQRNQSFHNNAEPRNQSQFARYNQNPQGFPKHLPNVTNASAALVPSWAQGQNAPTTNQSQPNQPSAATSNSANNERLNNPFVPLQVQTSQRRVQNTGGSGPSTRKEELPEPNNVLPKPQPSKQSVPQQQNSSRPVKKRKPRIAANLPFHTE